MRRRPDALTAIAAGLMLLLLVLAIVQYRWLGQVSAADRTRLRADVTRRAEGLARDFDREVTRAFFWLSVRDEPSAFPERYQTWKARAAWPDLVKTVFLVEVHDDDSDVVRAYAPARHAFERASWPRDLPLPKPAPPRDRSPRRGPEAFRAFDGFRFGPVLGHPPALIQPLHRRWGPFERGPKDGPAFGEVTVVLLDLGAIRERVLPDLVRRHFGGQDEPLFSVRVIDEESGTLIYATQPTEAAHGDVAVSLLGLRPDELTAGERDRAWRSADAGAGRSRRGTERWRPALGGRGPVFAGAWRLEAAPRPASVDAIVGAARLRNMVVSFGILAVLGAAVALLVVSARRLRRLAQRQMAFVATVAHELRTPVAVIGSAAENLADGVVSDPRQVREYGALVRDEGRRLGNLVEQALELARASSRRPADIASTCTVGQLVTGALEDSDRMLRAGEFVVETDVDREAVEVRGDRESLVRALRNLIENAVRYSGDSRWIRVFATTASSDVRVGVEDHGLGLEEDERETLFEPFVRGREATNLQIHGTGLGLAVVRGVMDSVGGRVEVQSAPGVGSTFALVLPIVRRARRAEGEP